MPTITVRHDDGSEETIPQTTKWTRRRQIGAMRRARITVERPLAEAVTLEPKSDEIDLGTIDTLRLVDVETGGPTWTLVCYSFEWDANRIEPTVGGNLRQGTDQSLVSGLVTDVPSWTAGTINSFTSGLSFVFNHAHRHEALRRIERNVPGEIQFRDSGTVDYVSRLGSDRSGSVTLSSTNQNIEDSITITKRKRELDGTHIRVLGAHEGEAQLYANLVPSTDGATYENRVDYSTSRWSPGDARDWDRWSNKDVTDQATLEEEAAALADEITEPLIEATTTVSGVDLNVGDTVTVTKPDADLDRPMRVHRIKTVATGAKQVDEVLLSTRTVMRNDSGADLRDIQRFNTAFQGSAVWGTPSGGIQAVDPSLNYELSFYYPDVEYEHRAEIQVKSLPYRAYSSGASVQNGTTLSLIGTNTVGGPTQLSPGTDVDVDVTVDSDFNGYVLYYQVDIGTEDTGGAPNDQPVDVTVDGPNAPAWHSELAPDDLGNIGFIIADPNVGSGDTVTLTVANPIGASNDIVVQGTTSLELNEPDHDHGVSPGVDEFPTRTASACDIIVNGTTTDTNVGTGEFETEVDISDELLKGAWNTVEVTSDTLGLLNCTLGLEAYRQIGKG